MEVKLTITGIIRGVDRDDAEQLNKEGWEGLLRAMVYKGIKIESKVEVTDGSDGTGQTVDAGGRRKYKRRAEKISR